MALSSRSNSNGETPLYCRLTYKQRQKRFMIGCTVLSSMWDQPKQKAKGKSSKAETVNQQINKVVQEIYKAEAGFIKQGEPFEVEDIVIRVQGREKSACRTLMQLYQYRFKQMKKLEGIDYKASSLQKFLEMAAAVRYFLMDMYGTEDIPLSKLNIMFIQNLESYLKTDRAMRLITVNKVIQKLKSVTNMAMDNGWMSINPFPGHRFKHDRLNVVYLTVDELDQLENFDFA